MSVNRWALKHIRQSVKKSLARAGGKTLHILIGNFMLLRDHPESQNKIHDNYKSELLVIVAHLKGPNVYTIQSLNKKGPKRIVNRWQLFDLKSLRRIRLQQIPVSRDLIMNPNWRKNVKPQIIYPFVTRLKIKAAPVSIQSVETDTHSEQKGHLGLGQWARNLFGTIKDATVWEISSAKRWSLENVLS